MSKTITLTYNDVEYTLEFTRKSIETMENQGFKVSEIADKPAHCLPKLFAGAFIAHHRGLKQATVDEIYKKIPNKTDFLQKLAEMYNEPLEALLEEPSESEGNAVWGANW